MSTSLHKNRVRVAAMLSVAALWPAQLYAADPYIYNIIRIEHTRPAETPIITFSVTNTATGQPADIKTDPAWIQTASGSSRLFFQIAWDNKDFNNGNSLSNTVPNGRGAAMPIPVDALGASVPNVGRRRAWDGTFSVTSPLPIPADATGSGRVAMEGHPAGLDTVKNTWTLRVPVKSKYRDFAITDTTIMPRRQIVDVTKCMNCHKTDGSGVAERLTLHGSNRTEEPGVCVVCHNANNTDIPFRGYTSATVTWDTNPTVVVGRTTYREQGIDFKRLVHGIHASSAGFRDNPLVVIGRNGSIFDAATLTPFPGKLRNCVLCHIDNGTRGTFELQASGPPLGPDVLGSTMDSMSEDNPPRTGPNNTWAIDSDATNNIRISPTAAACSSCHDDRETISHMIETGRASFNTKELKLVERCNNCHGPGKDKSVRKVHDISGSSSDD